MAGTLKNLDCHPIKIGGVEEHVHVFCSLSKNIALSDLIGRLKVGRPREAVLGLPSRNCTPRRGVGRCFQGGRFLSLHPGLKRPTSQSLRRGWLFGVTYHNMRGAIASATAAWAILLDRSAVARKRPNSRPALQRRLVMIPNRPRPRRAGVSHRA